MKTEMISSLMRITMYVFGLSNDVAIIIIDLLLSRPKVRLVLLYFLSPQHSRYSKNVNFRLILRKNLLSSLLNFASLNYLSIPKQYIHMSKGWPGMWTKYRQLSKPNFYSKLRHSSKSMQIKLFIDCFKHFAKMRKRWRPFRSVFYPESWT